MLQGKRTTIGYSTNPFTSAFYNYDRGFDQYTGLDSDIGVRIKRMFGNRVYEVLNSIYSRFVLGLRGNSGDVRNHPEWYSEPAESVYSTVQEQIPDDDPWFAWVHNNDPHFPLEPPEDHLPDNFESRSEAQDLTASFPKHLSSNDRSQLDRIHDLYDAECRYWDEQFESFHRSLPDDTLVVVVGDHGELMEEFGYYGHPPKMWDPLLGVPCVIYHPDLPSKDIGSLQTSMDLAPTIIDLLGESIPAEMRGEPIDVFDPDAREFIYGNTHRDNGFVQTSEWRWTIHTVNPQFEFDSPGLYPTAENDQNVNEEMLHTENPKIASRLEDRYYQEISTEMKATGIEGHGGLEEHLEDLGYI